MYIYNRACFQTFPGNDSVGELCYRGQTGSKVYNMLENLTTTITIPTIIVTITTITIILTIIFIKGL